MDELNVGISEGCVLLQFGLGRVRVMTSKDGISVDIETPDGNRVIGTWASFEEIREGSNIRLS